MFSMSTIRVAMELRCIAWPVCWTWKALWQSEPTADYEDNSNARNWIKIKNPAYS